MTRPIIADLFSNQAADLVSSLLTRLR